MRATIVILMSQEDRDTDSLYKPSGLTSVNVVPLQRSLLYAHNRQQLCRRQERGRARSAQDRTQSQSGLVGGCLEEQRQEEEGDVSRNSIHCEE